MNPFIKEVKEIQLTLNNCMAQMKNSSDDQNKTKTKVKHKNNHKTNGINLPCSKIHQKNRKKRKQNLLQQVQRLSKALLNSKNSYYKGNLSESLETDKDITELIDNSDQIPLKKSFLSKPCQSNSSISISSQTADINSNSITSKSVLNICNYSSINRSFKVYPNGSVGIILCHDDILVTIVFNLLGKMYVKTDFNGGILSTFVNCDKSGCILVKTKTSYSYRMNSIELPLPSKSHLSIVENVEEELTFEPCPSLLFNETIKESNSNTFSKVKHADFNRLGSLEDIEGNIEKRLKMYTKSLILNTIEDSLKFAIHKTLKKLHSEVVITLKEANKNMFNSLNKVNEQVQLALSEIAEENKAKKENNYIALQNLLDKCSPQKNRSIKKVTVRSIRSLKNKTSSKRIYNTNKIILKMLEKVVNSFFKNVDKQNCNAKENYEEVIQKVGIDYYDKQQLSSIDQQNKLVTKSSRVSCSLTETELTDATGVSKVKYRKQKKIFSKRISRHLPNRIIGNHATKTSSDKLLLKALCEELNQKSSVHSTNLNSEIINNSPGLLTTINCKREEHFNEQSKPTCLLQKDDKSLNQRNAKSRFLKLLNASKNPDVQKTNFSSDVGKDVESNNINTTDLSTSKHERLQYFSLLSNNEIRHCNEGNYFDYVSKALTAALINKPNNIMAQKDADCCMYSVLNDIVHQREKINSINCNNNLIHQEIASTLTGNTDSENLTYSQNFQQNDITKTKLIPKDDHLNIKSYDNELNYILNEELISKYLNSYAISKKPQMLNNLTPTKLTSRSIYPNNSDAGSQPSDNRFQRKILTKDKNQKVHLYSVVSQTLLSSLMRLCKSSSHIIKPNSIQNHKQSKNFSHLNPTSSIVKTNLPIHKLIDSELLQKQQPKLPQNPKKIFKAPKQQLGKKLENYYFQKVPNQKHIDLSVHKSKKQSKLSPHEGNKDFVCIFSRLKPEIPSVTHCQSPTLNVFSSSSGLIRNLNTSKISNAFDDLLMTFNLDKDSKYSFHKKNESLYPNNNSKFESSKRISNREMKSAP